MNKSRHLFLTMIIGILMCFSICVTASAQTINPDEEIHQTKIKMKNKWGEDVDVFFANTNTGATYNDVQDIIDDDPNALSFTIYEVGKIEAGEDSYAEAEDPSTRSWSPPIGSTHKYETTKTVTVPSRVVRDDFVISVAKGQTTTLCLVPFISHFSFLLSCFPEGIAAKLLKGSVAVTDSTQYHMAKRHITGQWLPPLTC